ncbi:MAG: hypothetical protein MZW92_01585 [Comamonadaceae bacterium]|nr:hypothetical protein [Comamonadaceae bacterium]
MKIPQSVVRARVVRLLLRRPAGHQGRAPATTGSSTPGAPATPGIPQIRPDRRRDAFPSCFSWRTGRSPSATAPPSSIPGPAGATRSSWRPSYLPLPRSAHPAPARRPDDRAVPGHGRRARGSRIRRPAPAYRGPLRAVPGPAQARALDRNKLMAEVVCRGVRPSGHRRAAFPSSARPGTTATTTPTR